MKKLVAILNFVAITLGIYAVLNTPRVAEAQVYGPNLITNPSLEIETSTSLPQGWQKGGYGTNTATFTYPTAGQDSQKAAKVSISKYASGDRKWYFDDVVVKPNTKYIFSSYYKSNTNSEVDVRYTNKSNKQTYLGLSNLGTSNNEWKKNEIIFTTPSNVKSLTIFHIIGSKGEITIDNYSLYEVPVLSPTPSSTPVQSTKSPTFVPTATSVSTSTPTVTISPTFTPTVGPTLTPTPTVIPTSIPTATVSATNNPTIVPTNLPTSTPVQPTELPTINPTPTLTPTVGPTLTPTINPTIVPTFTPTSVPTIEPTIIPTATANPTSTPMQTTSPTDLPTSTPVVTVLPSPTLLSTPTLLPTMTASPTATASTTPTLTPSPSVAPSSSPTPTATPVNNGGMILNGSVEQLSTDGQNPLNWSRGGWGTNTSVFTYPAEASDGQKGIKVELTAYTNGDIKWWFDEVAVQPNTLYSFSDSYKSNVSSNVTIQYKLSNGTYSYVWLADLAPSANWTDFSTSFTTPNDVVSMTVFHSIASVGWLVTDNFKLNLAPTNKFDQGMVSFNFDDGYLSVYQNAIPMLNAANIKSTQYIISETLAGDFSGYVNAAQVLAMQAQGHEIGAHSVTHADLILSTPTDLTNEVSGSKLALESAGVNIISSFAYPYGDYNSAVIQALISAGYEAGRGAYPDGENYKDTNKYELKVVDVQNSTPVETVKAWVDQAVANKSWVIFMYHQIDNGGDQYSTTPTKLQEEINYVVSKGVKTVTNKQGVALMNP